jgi:hypothetical protein
MVCPGKPTYRGGRIGLLGTSARHVEWRASRRAAEVTAVTIKKGQARDIDNQRLYSLPIGETYLPSLKAFLPWEGLGERAVSILLARHPRLTGVVSQPESMNYRDGAGRNRRYTADYLVLLGQTPRLFVEAKGAESLAKESVRDKLSAVDFEMRRHGDEFLVIDGTELSRSVQLRNTVLLRRYAQTPVLGHWQDAMSGVFRSMKSVPLGVLVDGIADLGMQREHVYSLIYRGTLTIDWDVLIDDASLVWRPAEQPVPYPFQR